MKKRPSIADIAARLKMSKASVAAAFSTGKGNTRISEATAFRVREMARKMNYRLNSSARAIRGSRFNAIGFFVAKKKGDDYTAMDIASHGIIDAAEAHGQTVHLVSIPTAPDGSFVVPRSLRENCLDALVIQLAMALPPEFHDEIESSGVPVVFMNEKHATNAISIDDLEGGRIMTEFLIAQGFRRIAVFSPLTRFVHYSHGDRIEGYSRAMGRAGLDPVVWRPESPGWEEKVRGWLKSARRPEAVFCTDDQFALLLQRLLLNMGLRVPDDISVAGCNNDALAVHSPAPLTTLQIPFYEMGKAAVEMAVGLVGRAKPLPAEVLHASLVVRDSVRLRRG